jgi:hypothetical protein
MTPQTAFSVRVAALLLVALGIAAFTFVVVSLARNRRK